ncbi:MAG TPA: hypothetical protein VGD69_27615 [Herpetosiphonaceae bacterium]
MPTLRPHLLTIGAHSLRTRHIRPRHAPTLLAGYDAAVRLLDPARPVHPTVILLQLDASEPGFPGLAAPLLAAVLSRRMEAGELHPAWLIGLATEDAGDLATEAQVAGCQLVLPSPLPDDAWPWLFELAQTPIPPRTADPAIQIYQRVAERVLTAVQAAQITLWTVDDVEILLGYLTRYPVPEAPPAQSKRVLRMLGGYDAASQRLAAMVDAWRDRFPLHAAVLQLFLDGANRREIVHFFVSRELYEDSRIYACIKRLPERIAQELRLAQVREGSV